MTPIAFHPPEPPAVHAPATVDADRLVRVLCALEGNDWTKPGGGLQFTPRVWHEESGLPFKFAQYRPQAIIIAKQRIARFSATLVRFGLEPSPEILAGAWRFGLTGAMKHWKRGDWADYETRGGNLYRDPDFK